MTQLIILYVLFTRTFQRPVCPILYFYVLSLFLTSHDDVSCVSIERTFDPLIVSHWHCYKNNNDWQKQSASPFSIVKVIKPSKLQLYYQYQESTPDFEIIRVLIVRTSDSPTVNQSTHVGHTAPTLFRRYYRYTSPYSFSTILSRDTHTSDSH